MPEPELADTVTFLYSAAFSFFPATLCICGESSRPTISLISSAVFTFFTMRTNSCRPQCFHTCLICQHDTVVDSFFLCFPGFPQVKLSPQSENLPCPRVTRCFSSFFDFLLLQADSDSFFEFLGVRFLSRALGLL